MMLMFLLPLLCFPLSLLSTRDNNPLNGAGGAINYTAYSACLRRSVGRKGLIGRIDDAMRIVILNTYSGVGTLSTRGTQTQKRFAWGLMTHLLLLL